MSYDVIIAGGSVAGLLCAREISSKGFSVLVIEEDYEIGTPEHCGGLVSIAGLAELGVIPFRKTFDHMIDSAEITSPNGNSFTINSKKQKFTVNFFFTSSNSIICNFLKTSPNFNFCTVFLSLKSNLLI